MDARNAAPSPLTSQRLLSTTLLAASLGVAALPVRAQEDGILLPQVDVQATAWRSWQRVPGYVAPVTTTGSKTDTPLIEAPQSLGIVTRDQIDDQAGLSVAQALRYTAGVLPEVRPSARYDSVFVRGFGGQGTAAAFVNFQDGLRQGRGLFFGVPNTDPWLLERIEVLRGPASVLYGQTGAGGLVNLVSRRPSPVASNEVRKLGRIAARLAGLGGNRPGVMVHAHAGGTPCCSSPGRGAFDSLVRFAGGHNIGADILPGTTGQLALEYVLTRNPDVYVATGGPYAGRGGRWPA